MKFKNAVEGCYKLGLSFKHEAKVAVLKKHWRGQK